ncbi:TetR/AcrR family transcriptional regulator [Streptomyces sp. HNM0574]|uniref:TetR/AcrR family transcriptional regulator n=1 Tax=Streptomyces sp. HNM0574 TaxID=2714954 RepID=UPI00146CA684|nr:TetR/AcrR family transcriptional regulator [Streptomyces sp. HNM0574]NLU66289.1 TetR/AcrR family transcriptional regulator [Streptomyces sp. HNM0574]
MAQRPAAERGGAVRERLLASARVLIGELGWNGVSTRVLAQRAEVRPGLVHYHFASLPALLRQAALGTMRPMLDEAAALFAAAATPADGAEALLRHLDRYSGRDPASLLVAEAYLTATRDEELRGALAELVAAFHGRLTDSLARAGHPTPEAAATALMTVLDGFVLHRGLNSELACAPLVPLVRSLVEGRTGPEGEHR